MVQKIEGAPIAAAAPVTHADVATDKPATVLSSLHGAVALGTSAGLLTSTLADDPPAAPVLGVAASFGAIMVVTASSLVQIDTTGATTIGTLLGATGVLAIDANGDVWTAGPDKLTRFATGAKVSFAADVKPFFASHCATCHGTDLNGAPKDDFLDDATAKERSATILKRIAGDGAPVMPPATREVLTPSDYAVVTRWMGGGFQP